MTPRSRFASSTLALALAAWLPACESAGADAEAGLTPIERLLREDSIYRATTGDSTQRHVGFDYENLNRVVWQKPDLLLARIGPLEGRTVVEVGAGTGFFTRRLARRSARVIALDVDPGMLLLLDSLNAAELDTAAYGRVDPRLVPADDPTLSEAEGDAALVVNTFMYIPERAEYLGRLARGLRPGSPVLIVDFKKKGTPVGPPVEARLDMREVEVALESAGYTDVSTDDTTLDYQYIVSGRAPGA